MASEVLAPSVSTTVRTIGPAAGAAFSPGAPVAPGLPPVDPPAAWDAKGALPPAAGTADLGLPPIPGVTAGTPAGLPATPATPAGRGGKEILIVSLRRSAGGLGETDGTLAWVAGVAAPLGMGGVGIWGIPGTPGGLGIIGTGGAPTVGDLGIEGGANRMVSFFMPGGTGA